ncbi:hypothetical protein GCM10022276_29220 [Sphingomonas limnosediminicola]|uniref:Uncharacterized protein n=1 Tax=Sphingomonas limnosediminicola TaxID=940133 RepID=A0ABP7LWR9_9SPHN
MTVDRQRVTQKQLLEIAVKAAARRGIVVYDEDAPYQCFASAIITMQQAGMTSVDAAKWENH